MKTKVPYGRALMVHFPLLDAGAQAFADDQSGGVDAIASGDAKILRTSQPWANLGAEQVDFTSGEDDTVGNPPVKLGDLIEGATSGSQARVIGVLVRSGTWAGGDAAGSLIVQGATGAFQAENLNNETTGQANFATIGGDLAELIFEYDGNYGWALGLTDAEMATKEAVVRVKDQTETELWEDVDVAHLVTVDHPLAGDPEGCLFAGVIPDTDVTAGTLVGEDVDGVGHPVSENAAIAPTLVIYIESATTGAGQAVPVGSFVHGTRTFTLLHNWPLTPTGTIIYKVYSIARMPAHVMSKLSSVPLSTSELESVETGIKNIFQIVDMTVDDVAAAADAFDVSEDAGTDLRTGLLLVMDGDLAGEGRRVLWSGTGIVVQYHDDMPASWKAFSTALANGVALRFYPGL